MSEEKKQHIQSIPQSGKIEGSFTGKPVTVKRVIPPPKASSGKPPKK